MRMLLAFIALAVLVGAYSIYLVKPPPSAWTLSPQEKAEAESRHWIRIEAIAHLGWAAGNSRPVRTDEQTAKLAEAFAAVVDSALLDVLHHPHEAQLAYLKDKMEIYDKLFQLSMLGGAERPVSPDEIERRLNRFKQLVEELASRRAPIPIARPSSQ